MKVQVGRIERKRQIVRECDRLFKELWDGVGRRNKNLAPGGHIVWGIVKSYWEYENKRISGERRKKLIRKVVEKVETMYEGAEIDWKLFREVVNQLLTDAIKED